jgi:hypothetical protein
MTDEIRDLLNAAEEYDRPASEAAAHALVAHVRKTGEALDESSLRKALTALRNNRWFDLLLSTADDIQEAGDERSFVRRLYAQALVDSGAIMAAIPFLRALIADSPKGEERSKARGILGRAWKQAYVNGEYEPKRGKELLENAIRAYYESYTEDASNYYPGINTVACLARAQRDDVRLDGRFPDWRELARTIRNGIDIAEKLESWDYATAVEASWALGEPHSALKRLRKYLPHPDASAFAVAATLRQLTQVWGVTTGDPDSGALIHVLEAALLKKEGGEFLELSPQSGSIVTKGLEAILGEDTFQTLAWYQRGLTRARAVARIGIDATDGAGTGFLVNACDLDPSLSGQLLITNHHVVPVMIPNLQRVIVIFEALSGIARTFAVEEILWTSEPDKLDATVLRLKGTVEGVEPYPMCTPPPPLIESKPRLYIIGHPKGGTMQFSISDNLIIDYEEPKVHYRTPTTYGSSGSPVFDSEWNLFALHHGFVNRKLPEDVVYSANEGLYFPTIVRQFAARPK